MFSGPVHEPLEPGGDGEEGPRELPHSLTADHQEGQRGESAQDKEHIVPMHVLCMHASPLSTHVFGLCLGSGAVSV